MEATGSIQSSNEFVHIYSLSGKLFTYSLDFLELAYLHFNDSCTFLLSAGLEGALVVANSLPHCVR